jgi:FKBP-type peptidyl-prolyl cis-trans isomerase (trigger factor)
MAKQTTSTSPKKSEPKQPALIIDNTVLSLTIPWKLIEAEYDKALARSAKQLKLKGFRKGMVPKKIAEEQLNREQLIDRALQVVMPPLYTALIKKENKEPLTNPEFNPTSMEWGKDWIFEVHIAEKPEVKLGDYKKILKESRKGVAAELKRLEKEHEAEHNKPGHTHDHGSDEDKEREVTLRLAFKALVEKIRPQVPELLLKEETKQEMHRLSQELQRMGLTLDNYLERRKQSFDDLSQELAAQTLGQLQLALVLEAMEKVENIQITEADKQKELDSIEDEKLREQMKSNPKYTEYLEHQLRRRELLNRIATA